MRKELVIEQVPELTAPILVLGFEGWPNGGNVAVGMLDFLIQALEATPCASINLNQFCRFDDVRPTVTIQGGKLNKVVLPEVTLYAAADKPTGRDLILLKGHEPHFRWDVFVDIILSLCRQWGIDLIISLGGLQDRVVHTDAIISGIASSPELLERLEQNDVIPIDYEGPSAIHSLILQEAKAAGIQGMSLWGHCPFYVQGTHLRLLSRMGSVLANLAGFQLDTTELEKGWMQLARQIQRFVDDNPELQRVIQEIIKSKTTSQPSGAIKTEGNVIYLDDFFGSKS
ncbi:MAG: PAC2 family protein [Thermodesulfobacteriota bacterium]|nr:PAC2 family protein [Thermodesulfobacteriota bacterium]